MKPTECPPGKLEPMAQAAECRRGKSSQLELSPKAYGPSESEGAPEGRSEPERSVLRAGVDGVQQAGRSPRRTTVPRKARERPKGAVHVSTGSAGSHTKRPRSLERSSRSRSFQQ
jgi:hypothetical protein